MFNPCDLAITRTPKAPSLNGPGELTLETRPDGELPEAKVEVPGVHQPGQRVIDGSVIAAPNPLAAAAGELEPMRGRADETPDLDQALPAVAQKVLDLIARNGPALDSALSAIAGKPAQEERRVMPMGGRLGRGAIGDDLRSDRGEAPRRPSRPPQAKIPVAPPEDLAPPLEPVPVEPEKLAELPAPPSPKPLEPIRQEAIATPWTPQEGERLRMEAPTVLVVQVQVALRHLDELETFVGGGLRMATDRTFKGFQVTNRQGFRRLAGLSAGEQAGPVGAYLVALHDLYRSYKADYYSLARARRVQLDRRDPAALVPLVSEEELEDYLWRKYGEALRGRLWSLLRTSARHHDGLPSPLGADRPWHSGGEEPSFELVKAGVFVALRSEDGDLELHKEQGNPWSAQGIFNLAVAVRLGRDVVAYDVRSGVLKINGRVVPWSNGVYELPEGGRLELDDECLQLVSLRGDTVVMKLSGRTLVLSGTVSGNRPVNSVAGALGAFQDGLANAWTDRDGREVATVEALLESWRPRRGEALL